MDEGNLRSKPDFPISSRLLKSIDALAVLSTIGAIGLLSSPNLSPAAANALQVVTETLGGYFLLRGYFALRDRVGQRNYRILTGQENIRRKEKQLYVFGGDGHPAVDLLFQSNPAQTIPIYSSLSPAESLINHLRRLKRTSLDPFFINLDIDQESGKTPINTPALERLDIDEENLLSAPNGLRFATYGFGGSLVSSMLHKPDESLTLDDQEILHKRLLSQVREILSSDHSLTSAMVRIADAYRIVKQTSFLGLFSELVERHRIEGGPNTLDFSPERSVIWVDVITPIVKELLKYAKPGWGVVLNTTVPGLQLPFLDEFGLVSMNVSTDETTGIARSGNYITVVIEADDAGTLVALENSTVKRKRKEYIPLFNSHKAAEIARQWGYQRAISVAEVYARIINGENGIQRQLEQGSTPIEIQLSLDEEYLHQKCLDKAMA